MKTILQPGHNAWRVERAGRLAFLIDGKNYYRAFRSALLQARERVVLLAWDLHSEIELERDDRDDGYPREFGAFVNAVLDDKPQLEMHVLVWDFSMIYAAEREWKAFSRWLRDPHPRLHFWRDDRVPFGASHHQKIVLVDDALAFTGGLDLAAWRWDDPAHVPKDPRRTDPQGEPYEPYHDVQVALTGEAARALGDLCAERWKRATGDELPRVDDPPDEAPWPEGVETDARDVDVAFSRTFAPFEPYPAVTEVEELHLDVIRSAEDYIFFENQYLSSRLLVDAIIERLREPDGPEIVLIITADTHGWLEEGTMGLHRDRLLERMHDADEHGRLRVRYPRVRNEEGESEQVYIHAKVIVVDDGFVKVGSSNLSNRSMRVDSEIDLAVEDRPDLARGLLHRLLAMHRGTTPEVIEAKRREHGSLRGVVDDPSISETHTFEPLDFQLSSSVERNIADAQLFDPPVPIDPDYWVKRMVEREQRPNVMRRITIVAALVAVGLAIALFAKWGWFDGFDRETVTQVLESVSTSPWAPLVLIGLIFAAGLTGLSLNAILVAAAVVLGPWTAFACSLLGGQLSAIVGFWLGRVFGRPLVAKLGHEKVQSLSRKLGDRGLFSVAFVRVVPLAPFVVINVVAGASHLKFSTFNLGSVVGMTPGMLGVVLLTTGVESVLREPSWTSVAWLVAIVVVVVGGLYLIRRALGSRRARRAATDDVAS